MTRQVHMHEPMRSTGHRLIMGCVLASAALFAHAQGFPEKTITLVVPVSPGGATDNTARLLATIVSKRIGQQVVVENRPGSGGAVGLGAVARAAPDGYTLAFTPSSSVTFLPFMTNLPFDPARDLQPISLLAAYDMVLVANAALPANTTKELVDLATSKPGSIPVGITAGGASVMMALFSKATNTSYLKIPYKGGAPTLLALTGGEVSLGAFDLATVLPMIESGRIKAIGVTSLSRSAKLPNVPTIAETYPGFEMKGWFGLFAPRGTPRDRIEKLEREFAAAMQLPEVRKTVEGLTLKVVGSTAAELEKTVADEYRVFGAVIKENGIRLD